MVKKIFAVLFAFFAVAALSASAFAAGVPVDVNTASQAELEAVKGIGPTMSAKILNERKKAAFKSWPDLVERVPGIGQKSATKLSNAGLTVGGAAFNGAAASSKEAGAKKSAKVAAPAASVTGKTKM